MKFLSLSLTLLLSSIASASIITVGPQPTASASVAELQPSASASVVAEPRPTASASVVVEPRPTTFVVKPQEHIPIAPTEQIAQARSAILKAWEEKRDSSKLSGEEKEQALQSDFAKITADHFNGTLPDANILVILGKHQFTDIEGPMDRYDESIVIDKQTFTYTVMLFNGGKLTMENDGNARQLLLRGNCMQPIKEQEVWTCTSKAKAKESQEPKEDQKPKKD
ncbi:hypothetical protein BD779DRAFT_1476921 [Infundibulicybe gibba]|nr:hypothetical protein BD779DRAFT_1476921 [Infundibulicybe gibba]